MAYKHYDQSAQQRKLLRGYIGMACHYEGLATC